MKANFACVTLTAALAAFTVPATAGDAPPSSSTERLEALKKLAGDWVELGKDGKPTDKVVSSIRVTAAGSAVEELMFPGSNHEMVTLYHLDGPDLLLTHYCAMGNAPRLRADPGTDVHKMVFKFVSGTNLKSADDHHISQATLTLVDKDHFKAEWVSCKGAKPCHRVDLDLVRKSK